ncbi:hypothetical protein TNCV_4226751 [Trichonephila clavipes]|nr:hypothetical protein TNCV_4226751 [Trichonephila clavipes]
MYRHTGPAQGTVVWSGIGFHRHTPLVRIAGTLNCQSYIFEVMEALVFIYIQCLPHQPYSNRIMYDHTWHAMFKNSFLPISLNCFLGLLLLMIYRQSKTCDPSLHNDWPVIHPPLLHQINFGNIWKPHGLLYLNDTSKASLVLCRGVWQRLKRKMVATITTDFVIIHTSQEAVILKV